MSIYRDQLENWLKQQNIKAERLLDVGGGQKPLPNRVASFDVEEYKILDFESEFKPDIFADINSPMTEELKKELVPFDVVTCLEVFEYVWNPVQALQNLNSFLKTDGKLYISFPTIYPLHAPEGMDYLRYTKYAIEKLFSETGFTDWILTPRVASRGLDDLRDFYVNEAMKPLRHTTDIYHIGYMAIATKYE